MQLHLVKLHLGALALKVSRALASLQVRLASDKASTRRRRQAQTLESSITAKRRNSRMRPERRQATRCRCVAAPRCARRDATHSDAFEQRFLFRVSHSLRETHLIVRKLKLQSMEWRGACSLSIPGPLNELEDDADLQANKWNKYAMFYA